MTKQTFTTGQVLTAAQMTSLQQTAMGGGSTTAKTASYVLVAADAGTVVQMNSASATTITVNTALFAAGDEVNIQNVGAGVCTVTAGTATVSTAGSLALSQYEGGQLYFNTTSAALFFDIVQSSGMTNPMTTTGDIIYSSSGSTPARLGIGSSAQVLTVASGLPSWATPSSGGMTLISTTALTGASITLSSIAGTYNNIVIILQDYELAASTPGALQYQLNSDTTANAHRQITQSGQSTTNTNAAQTGTSFTTVDDTVGYNPATNYSQITIYDYANAVCRKAVSVINAFGGNTGNIWTQNLTGSFTVTTAITSVKIALSAGTFSSGNALLYGVK